MAKFRSKIARGEGVEATFSSIREMIVYGRLAPGSWIVEGDIAANLGVSRTPVRHALQWLHHEGYVVPVGSGPKNRMTVAPLTQKDAAEVYRLVGHMEGLAGRLAAELLRSERLDLTRHLKEVNAQLAEAGKAEPFEPKTFFDLDTLFHSKIVEATAGSRFLSIYNGIKPHTERYWWLYASSLTGDQTITIREHAQIISAIANGDPDGAEKALQANWENGALRLSELIRKFGERGKW